MNKTLPESIGRLGAAPRLIELAHALTETRAATASGLWGSSVAAVVASVQRELKRPIFLVCGHLDEADDLSDDVELFSGIRPEVLPALELIRGLGQMSEEQVVNRLKLISRLAMKSESRISKSETNPKPEIQDPEVLIAPIQALMQSVPARDQLEHLIRTLRVGQELEPEKLIVWLSDHGYNRLEQVEAPGDFAVRGGIIDMYLPGEFDAAAEQVGLTARIDFFGDQIESIRRFDLDTLGSLEALESVQLFDLKGQIPDTSASTHLLSYLNPQTIVVLWAPLEIAEQAKSYLDRLPEQKGVYPLAALLKQMGSFARLELSQFDQASLIGADKAPHFKLPIESLQKFETEAKKAIVELNELAQTHEVTVFCENTAEAQRFSELLDQDAPGLRETLSIAIGYLHRGFVWRPIPPLPPGEGGGEGAPGTERSGSRSTLTLTLSQWEREQ